MIPHVSFTELVVGAAVIYAVGYIMGAWRSYKYFKKGKQ